MSSVGEEEVRNGAVVVPKRGYCDLIWRFSHITSSCLFQSTETGTNNHSGNIKFRQMVNSGNKLRYLAASKSDKPKVAAEVVKMWRALDPPGRFLTRKDPSRRGPGSVKAEGNIWTDVGDKKAREKASQCLRERTPDVIPFVREIQRQQDILIGKGLRDVEQQIIRDGEDDLPADRASQSPPLRPIHPPTMQQMLVRQPDPVLDHFAASNMRGFHNNAASLLSARAALNPYAHLAMHPLPPPRPDPLAASANVNLLMYAMANRDAANAFDAQYEYAARRGALHTALANHATVSATTTTASGPVKKRQRKSYL